MKGFIHEEALAEYTRLAAEKLGSDFSEGETYDFARCMRADGSFYGTSGKCRKGTDAGDKETPAQRRKEDEASPAGGTKKPRASAGELREAQAKLFDVAKERRAAAKEAEKAYKAVDKETKGDNSPEAKKRRLEAGRAWDKAGTAADRAQTAWSKAHERWSKASEREKRAKMSPSQKAETRRIDKIIKEQG
jgi:hypothetical protein